MKQNNKKYKIYGTDIYCSSKSEARVGEWLKMEGYSFLHDRKYPYEDINKNYRYDFMILNKSDKPEEIKTKYHIYIEVKENIKEIDEMLEEKNFVEDHGDVLITFYDDELIENVFREKLKLARKILDLQNENRILKIELHKK